MDIQERIREFIDRDLVTIQKPGRYVGGEFNQVKKDWEETELHIALAFPDIYDIGFPNLGIAALYNIINSQSNALAERVFAPWFDMEQVLRERNLPLFSLESKIPVNRFDVVGFTLPYETLYTNTLNLLDLSRIPVFSKDREAQDPIVIAGGHATYNPEPMHPFIDAFVIGEGEIAIVEILQALNANSSGTRNEKLQAISEISGLYVPSIHRSSRNNKRIPEKGIAASGQTTHYIQKRYLRKPGAPIQNLLVPNINVVHDRIAIEIMRGCSRGCRFCQAGMIMRPVRELSHTEIIATLVDSIERTGISEVSLLSLSTSDHTQITNILEDINNLSEKYHLDFSLPSLRVESFNREVMDTMQTKRKGNFTIAPEAGLETQRAAINKPIPESEILETVEQICERGWNNVKLYFMIGFPGETMDDIKAIIDLCRQIKAVGKAKIGARFKLHVSINTLIPKAHTPYQWAPLEKEESIRQKYITLIDGLKPLKIKIDYPDFGLIKLEALLSRGDGRISEVIYTAWKEGAKFDAWHEGFSADIWEKAIADTETDIDDYLYAERDTSEPLPWDHIYVGIEKSFLAREYEHNFTGETSPGCFQQCAACGINRNLQIDC